MAKSANDRHWHVAVPVFFGAIALAVMPIFMSRVAWLAFACLSVAAFGIWGVHGPLMSWPAVILSGTNAASGKPLTCCSSECVLGVCIYCSDAHLHVASGRLAFACLSAVAFGICGVHGPS